MNVVRSEVRTLKEHLGQQSLLSETDTTIRWSSWKRGQWTVSCTQDLKTRNILVVRYDENPSSPPQFKSDFFFGKTSLDTVYRELDIHLLNVTLTKELL
jgi:hypothetical protein